MPLRSSYLSFSILMLHSIWVFLELTGGAIYVGTCEFLSILFNFYIFVCNVSNEADLFLWFLGRILCS